MVVTKLMVVACVEDKRLHCVCQMPQHSNTSTDWVQCYGVGMRGKQRGIYPILRLTGPVLFV